MLMRLGVLYSDYMWGGNYYYFSFFTFYYYYCCYHYYDYHYAIIIIIAILENGYTELVFAHTISKFNSLPIHGPDKCPIYLKLP